MSRFLFDTVAAFCLCLHSVLLCGQTVKTARAAQPPLSAVNFDSLQQVYRSAQAQLQQVRRQMRGQPRFDEYTDNKGRPIRYNIVQVDVPNWLFGEPNLGYERKISHHGIVTLHVAFARHTYSQGDTAGNSRSLVQAIFYPDQYADAAFTTTTQMVKLVPEIRTYLGQNAPRGFYLGAYYYYRQIRWDLTYAVPGARPEQALSTAHSRLTTHGPGVVLGCQWIIKSRVSLAFELGTALPLIQGTSLKPLTPAVPAPRGDVVQTPVPIALPLILRLNAQVGYAFGR